MELDELDRAVVGQVAGQFAGEVGLAGPGRPVQDDLLALPEQVRDLGQFGLVYQQVLGEFRGDRVESQFAPGRLGDRRGGSGVKPCGTRAASCS